MRLDARAPGFHGVWHVYDVPACRMRRNVVWIDTDTAELGFYGDPPKVINMEVELLTEKRKKIELSGRTFLLDPIQDDDSSDVNSESERLQAVG